jgi:hypothetical protein
MYQRMKESERKVDEFGIKFDQKIEAINIKTEQKIEASNLKSEAKLAEYNLKFERMEQDKKTSRRSLPENIAYFLQSAVIIVAVIVYLTHK